MIRKVLETSSPVYLITASGTGAMEAAVANVTRPGSKVLVVSGGKFGDRWRDICATYNCRAETLHFEPGEAIDVDAVVSKVEQEKPEYLALTHVESSTGLLLPLEELVRALPDPRPVVIVDAIASIAVEELVMDDWGLDVVVGACQKAFAAPPGVSFISVGERAQKLVKNCTRELYYFSLKRYEEGRSSGDTPFTPAIEIMQMVYNALCTIGSLGWERMRDRHRKASRIFIEAARHISLESFPKSPSSAVQALILPAECRGQRFVETLAEKEGIIVADGQGPLRDSIIRTGFLGLYSGDTILIIIKALGALIRVAGCPADLESAERVAEELSDQADFLQ